MDNTARGSETEIRAGRELGMVSRLLCDREGGKGTHVQCSIFQTLRGVIQSPKVRLLRLRKKFLLARI